MLAGVVKEQHRRILELLDAVSSQPTSARRQRAVTELAAIWRAHARAEEEVLYPARSMEREEHAIIDFMLARVELKAPAAMTEARVRILRDVLIRHQDLEERVRLPAAAAKISPKEDARIARRLVAAVASAERALSPRASSASRGARGATSRRRGGAR